jgi:hypothetical protein
MACHTEDPRFRRIETTVIADYRPKENAWLNSVLPSVCSLKVLVFLLALKMLILAFS